MPLYFMNSILKSLLICVCILVLSTSTRAQGKVDSLEQELSNYLVEDTIRLNLYLSLIKQLDFKDQDKSLLLLEESSTLAKKINFIKGQASILILKGDLEIENSNYEQALDHYKEAQEIFFEINDLRGISNSYAKMGLAYYNNNEFETSITNYQKSIEIDGEIGDTEHIANSLKRIGFSYFDKGEFDSAFDYYDKALKLNVANNNKKEMLSCLNNMGSTYLKRANYPVALEYYNKALVISEEIKDTLAISRLLNNIGIVYKNFGELDKALENYKKSLAIQLQIGTKRNQAAAFGNIGSIYWRQGDFETALDYFKESLCISKEIDYTIGCVRQYNNIGNLHYQLKNPELSLDYHLQAKKLAKEIGYKYGLANSYVWLATVYNQQKKYDLALVNLKEGEKISDELELVYFQRDIQELYAQIYANTNDYRKALKSHQAFKVLHDSLFNEENIVKFTQLEFEYKHKQEIEDANNRELLLTKTVKMTSQYLEKSQRNSLFAIIGILLLSLVSGGVIFFLKLKQVQADNKNIRIQQKLLRSQMTPHFIFNSLSILQGMILDKERDKSLTYLSQFSKLLRLTLENSRHKTVSLSDELAAIDSYVSLQNLDADQPFIFTLFLDEKINAQDFNIPPMLIQPFIENAIEHAFINQTEAKNISLKLILKNDQLICTIKDNGIGVNTEKKLKNNSKNSLATIITSERLEMLAKEFNAKASVLIENRAMFVEKGTLLTLIIPYKIGQ